MSEAAARRSARVILLSPEDDVFLIRFVVQRSSGAFEFWATPGGEVEAGESDHAAAARELREELNIAPPLAGPVHAAESRFEHKGAMIDCMDVFFSARCAREAPRLVAWTEEERAVLREGRWWTLDEIALSQASIFPPGLDAIVSTGLLSERA